MTRQRTTPALLVVVALLLALNLAAALPWPAAQAQDEPQVWPPPPVEIIQVSAGDGSRVYRLWSDGTIEWNAQGYSQRPGGWHGWLAVPEFP